MTKLMAFVKLDFLTVKPYLTIKNLILFTAFAVFMNIGSENSGAMTGIFMIFAALYVSYPFAVGEKNGIDTLYATLSLSRGNVVSGRYMFALCVNVLAAVFSYLLTWIMAFILSKVFSPSETLASLAVLFLFISIVQAIQLPIYFKLGYAKAKFLAYLPFVALPLTVLAFSSVFKIDFIQFLNGFFEWINHNRGIASFLYAAVWMIALLISYLLSLAFYKKRDF